MTFSRSQLIALLATLSLGLMAGTVHADYTYKSVAAPTAQNPADIAKAAIERWKVTLKITDEQAPAFESLMMNSFRQMARAKSSTAGDKAKTYAAVQAVFTERDAALAKLLTPEQLEVYRNHVHHGVAYAKKLVDAEASSKK